MSYSEEEEIARNYICFSKPDCIIVVADATNLERNLNLLYQIMEMNNRLILCVNLLDEARKKGIKIDLKKLEDEIGIPVVGTIAHKKKSLKKLMQKVEDVCKKNELINVKTLEYKRFY